MSKKHNFFVTRHFDQFSDEYDTSSFQFERSNRPRYRSRSRNPPRSRSRSPVTRIRNLPEISYTPILSPSQSRSFPRSPVERGRRNPSEISYTDPCRLYPRRGTNVSSHDFTTHKSRRQSRSRSRSPTERGRNPETLYEFPRTNYLLDNHLSNSSIYRSRPLSIQYSENSRPNQSRIQTNPDSAAMIYTENASATEDNNSDLRSYLKSRYNRKNVKNSEGSNTFGNTIDTPEQVSELHEELKLELQHKDRLIEQLRLQNKDLEIHKQDNKKLKEKLEKSNNNQHKIEKLTTNYEICKTQNSILKSRVEKLNTSNENYKEKALAHQRLVNSILKCMKKCEKYDTIRKNLIKCCSNCKTLGQIIAEASEIDTIVAGKIISSNDLLIEKGINEVDKDIQKLENLISPQSKVQIKIEKEGVRIEKVGNAGEKSPLQKTSEEVKKLREEIFQQTNQIMNVVSENVKLNHEIDSLKNQLLELQTKN